MSSQGLALTCSYAPSQMRDYEVANTRPLPEEFVFVFDNGPPASESEPDARKLKRPRGAYFAPLGLAQTLRKRRPKRDEKPRTFPPEAEENGVKFWDSIDVKVAAVEKVDPNEAQDRAEFEADVVNPPSAA